jgi:dihydroceramide fatty acyl 2-hydroxylase
MVVADGHKLKMCKQVDGSNRKPKAIVPTVGHMGASYWEWVKQPEDTEPRFFEGALAESLTKMPPWLVPVLWIPFFSFCFVYPICKLDLNVFKATSCALTGLFLWYCLEYVIHRCLFHGYSTSYWGITLLFLFHGCHHKYPNDRFRLVMPPIVVATLLIIIFAGLHLLFTTPQVLAVMGGGGYGYVVYDCMHYAFHHGGRLPGAWLQDLKRRHAHHHYRDSGTGYGVSAAFVDIMLGTACR